MSSTLDASCSSRLTPQKMLNIPSRRIQIDDLNQITNSYSSTPGGTLFSTTPGGTRIIYERNFLMKMRNSPISKTSPKNLPYIAGVTNILPEVGKENKMPEEKTNFSTKNSETNLTFDKSDKKSETPTEEPQFSMDI